MEPSYLQMKEVSPDDLAITMTADICIQKTKHYELEHYCEMSVDSNHTQVQATYKQILNVN